MSICLRSILIVLSIASLAAAQDAVAYHISEPDASEGTRLYAEYQKTREAFAKWRSYVTAKYSSGGAPVVFTFDFRIAIPIKIDPKDKSIQPGDASSVWTDRNTSEDSCLGCAFNATIQ